MVDLQNADEMQSWRIAGKIAARALATGAEMCKPGVRLVEVVEAVEAEIRGQGLGMAFPCTVSLNEVAAHYTPDHLDERVFLKGDLVKVDCGAELNGALSDNAVTVEVDSTLQTPLIRASEACLEAATRLLGPSCDLGKVGEAVEEVARERGFKPISNLTGHSLETYNLHAGLTVPSVGMRIHRKPKAGDVLACEPFVTNGQAGRVGDGGVGNIYHFTGRGQMRMPQARAVLELTARRYPKLPFSQRWITDAVDPKKLNFYMTQLVKAGQLRHYPALVEVSGGLVAQRENTILITEDGNEVLTNPNANV